MNYRSVNDLNQLVWQNLHLLPADIDLVIGIPRSGLLPANLIALYKQLPLTDLDSFVLQKKPYQSGRRTNSTQKTQHYRHLLIVDDSLNLGSSLLAAKKQIAALKLSPRQTKVSYLAIYVSPAGKNLVDFYFEELANPRLFQWHIFHHNLVGNSCFDLDGVFCVDPLDSQNDDGEFYLDFLKNAQPLHLPSLPIHSIVTSRLEKYRPQTEAWLKKHGVKYQKLIMMDLPDKTARLNTNRTAEFKAQIYQQTNTSLFFESDFLQAQKIAQLTQKPVFCVSNFTMISPASEIISQLEPKNLIVVDAGKKVKTTDQFLRQINHQFENLQLQETQHFTQLSSQLSNFTNWKWWFKQAASYPRKLWKKITN